MKKTTAMFMAAAWMVGATAMAATGSSAWFRVDTTDGALKISDVQSKYFDGKYGGSAGRKATFLNGTPCEIEMKIVMSNYSEVDHWLVNGQTISSRTFSVDVGTIAVGGKLEVVAVGKESGVRSKPFRVNFDVAAAPSILGALTFIAQKQEDDVVYVTFPQSGELDLAESRTSQTVALNWLPQKTVKVAPKISVKTEMSSSGNGSLRLLQTEYGVENGKSILGTQTRRPDGKFAEAAGVSLGLNFIGGPLTATWNPENLRWQFHSVAFGMGMSGKYTSPPYYWGTPIGPVYLKLGAEVGISAQCEVAGFGAQDRLDTTFTLSSDRFPAFTATAGYGINNLLNVEGAVSGEFPIEAVCRNGEWTNLRYGIRCTGSLTANAFAFHQVLWSASSETKWLLEGGFSRSARLAAVASAASNDWQLRPRDYLKKETPRMRLMAAAPSDGVVESGGYPDPAPAMASGVAGDALAYLRDNAARSSADRTEFVMRTGTSNEWGAAGAVWDDGTADFMPSLAALPDGSIVAAWMNASRTFSDSVTMSEMCGAEEIAVGIRNVATGTWTCRNLTSDSAFDFAPAVRAGTNGTALVVWLRNVAGSLTGSAAEPTDIMASIYANGAWSAPTAVVSGAGAVNGFDVAFDGENAVLVFSKDADGDLETMDDAEMFAVRFNGSSWGGPVRLTYAGDADGRPLVRGCNGGFAVLWTEKGVLMETTELVVSNAVAVAAAEGWTLSSDCSVMRGVDGHDALVWSGDSTVGGAANAPVAMMYDPVCGAWGAPKKLLDDGRHERHLAGAVGTDGGIRLGYESSSVATNAEGEVIFGDVELRTRYISATCDLAVVEDGFSFASENLTDGDETVLTVKVENLGLRAATNATVTVYEGAGDEKSELASVVTNFPGGGIVAVSVPWTVDNTQSNLQFTVEIDAGGNEDDGADGNNVYVWNAGTYDVSFVGVTVRNESATRRLLTAAVSNAGLGPLPAGAKVVFRRGGESGEVLAVDEIGAVWPGANTTYNAGLAWDMEGVTFTSAWETVCVQLFPDGVVGSARDAADMAFGQVMTVLDSDGDGLLDAQEQQLGTNPNMTDTDGDGISDGDEVNVTRTDPLTANILLVTPTVTASAGTNKDGVDLVWTAVDGASGYEVWRSADGTAANAEMCATVSALSWFDEAAAGGAHYTYFVRAVGYAGASGLSTGAEGWRPAELRVVSSVLGGATNVTFNAWLVAGGGREPYTWALASGGGSGEYVETREASTFGSTGTAQGWQGDDSCWTYTLPFAFPFYGKTYSTAYINSNGTIAFDGSFSGYSESLATLKTHPMIAVLWDDLKTSSGNVYVTATADAVTFRWSGVYYSGSTAVNFSATLRSDGTIRLSYGSGNANGGLIGISPGDGATALVSAASQSGSMANATDVVFAVPPSLPDGLELREDGMIIGTSQTIGTNTVRVVVTDANGTRAEGEVSIEISAEPDPVVPEVYDVTAQQRYPWNGKVDVSYTVSGDVEGTIKVTATDRTSGETYTAKAVTGDLGTMAGTHSLVWDMAVDGLTFKSTNVTFSVSFEQVTPTAEQVLYMVVDLSGGTSASSYPVSYLADVPSGGWTDEYKTTKLVLRRIEPGTVPTRDITLTKPFYIGVFEVTQRQYELVTGNKPSIFPNSAYYATRPVEKVSYNMIRGSSNGAGWPGSSAVDSTSFIGILRAKAGIEDFDLPTEAQWEYACRAETITHYNNGKNYTNPSQDSAMDEVGRYLYNGGSDSSSSCTTANGTAAVGSYLPNKWGLYDMHGNVWEWCLDWAGGSFSGTDPVGSSFGLWRVRRGGCWSTPADSCISSFRDNYDPSSKGSGRNGFRLARTLSNTANAEGERSPEAVAGAERAEICMGESSSIPVDLTPGMRTAAATERVRYSSVWAEGAPLNAVAVVSVDGETLVSASGSGFIDWTPPSNGVYALTHRVVSDGVQIGETLTATFEVALASWIVVDIGGGKSVMVPLTWIDEHPAIGVAAGGDKMAALQSTAANGRMSVVECYVVGLDPEKADEDFKITSFPMNADGTPDLANIAFAPAQEQWNVPGATPVVKGAASLDGEWQTVTEENKAGFRFFKVCVELP